MEKGEIVENKTLKKLRGKKRQEDIAINVGISASYYSMVESGIRKPSLSVAIKLSQYFGVSVETLFNNITEGE